MKILGKIENPKDAVNLEWLTDTFDSYVTLATLNESITNINTLLDTKAAKTIKISAGTGLSGGGTLEADRTLSLAASGVTAGTYRSVTVDKYGRVTAGSNPTTLSGYGITDAKIADGVITLGGSTITPLTASSSLAWGKLTGKPTTLSGYGITDAYTSTKVDSLLSGYVPLATAKDITAYHNFKNGLKIAGLGITSTTDDVIYVDANLVVRGGVTIYATDTVDVPSIIDNLPIASAGDKDTASKGIAAFDSSQFTVEDGFVKFIGSASGVDETFLANYLTTNEYAVKSDIPTSLKSPYKLTMGSKAYDGSAAITLTASDLGALTAHQTIYALTINNSAGSAQVTYTPNSKTASLTLTKAMVGLGNVENTALSTWAGSSSITTLGTITSGTWNGAKIANAYLANSAVTISGTSVSLGGSITQAALRTALGLGSNAYTSTAYLPLSGGTLTGTLQIKTGVTKFGLEFDNSLGAIGSDGESSFVLPLAGTSYVRSGYTDLYHRRGSIDADYAILDGYNYASILDGRYYTESEINAKLSGYLPLTGGTLTGELHIENNVPNLITLKRTAVGAGAFIDYCPNNQSSVYWRAGAETSNEFGFLPNGNSAASHVSISYEGHLNIGASIGQVNSDRAEVSIVSVDDNPNDLMLGCASAAQWSITSRGSSQYKALWVYNYNKRGLTMDADLSSYSVRIGYGSVASYTAIDSTYTLDVCGMTRTTSVCGSSVQLDIVAESGYNATLRSNGGASGYNVALDIGTNSLRPFADSHVLLDLGSPNIYWRNVYAQKTILKSSTADILSLYRTADGGAWVDYYPYNQTTTRWRVGAASENIFGIETMTKSVMYRFTQGDKGYRFEVGQDYLTVAPAGTDVGRAVISIISKEDKPVDLIMGPNMYAWSITARSSSDDYFMGFYSALTNIYPMKIYKSGDVLVSGGVTMYSDIRRKTKLRDVMLSLKEVANAPLIEHYYNSDEKKTTHVGSIAQYWAGLNDWFCKTDNEGYYTMEIQNAALASAISVARELVKYESKTDKQIRKLKKRISELEDEIETLKKK